MRNICNRCGKPVGNITFSFCDACWNKEDKLKNAVLEELYTILKNEGLEGWKINVIIEHDGFCGQNTKTITIWDDFLIFLHEVAHALATPEEEKIAEDHGYLGDRHNNIFLGKYEYLIRKYLLKGVKNGRTIFKN
jgi:hypothetical protein